MSPSGNAPAPTPPPPGWWARNWSGAVSAFCFLGMLTAFSQSNGPGEDRKSLADMVGIFLMCLVLALGFGAHFVQKKRGASLLSLFHELRTLGSAPGSRASRGLPAPSSFDVWAAAEARCRSTVDTLQGFTRQMPPGALRSCLHDVSGLMASKLMTVHELAVMGRSLDAGLFVPPSPAHRSHRVWLQLVSLDQSMHRALDVAVEAKLAAVAGDQAHLDSLIEVLAVQADVLS